MSSESLITLGEDAEYFLRDISTKRLVSAIKHFKGTKTKPEPLPSRRGFVLHDNVLLESNVNPAESRVKWITLNQSVLGELSNILQTKNLELYLSAAEEFPAEELKSQEACLFGCSPDYNAWTIEENPRPDGCATSLRTAGGHIHIGKGTNTRLNDYLDNPYGKVGFVRMLDLFLGLPSIFLDKLGGTDKRRVLYGRAGAHRDKPYGVEYRVLSPWWKQSEASLGFVWDTVNFCARTLRDALEDPAVSLATANPSSSEDLDVNLPIVSDIMLQNVGMEQDFLAIINESKRDEAFEFFYEEVSAYLPRNILDQVEGLM